MWREVYHEIRCWAKAWSASSAHRRTEITVETSRVWIVRKSRSARCWCDECGREVAVVGMHEVAALPGADQRVLCEGAGGKGWHSVQTADGSTLICLESVLKSLPTE